MSIKNLDGILHNLIMVKGKNSLQLLYSLPFSRSFKNRFSRKVRKYGKV